MGYIENPKSIDDFMKNIKFQLSNVEGYISINSMESAKIKAECLMSATKEFIEYLDKGIDIIMEERDL